MSYAGGTRRIASARSALLHAVVAITLAWGAGASAQTCSFNPNNPNTTSFGAVDPTQTVTYTFSITINYRCTGSAVAAFTITGQSDTGAGAYRLQNVTQPAQYMRYSILLTDVPGTKLTLNGRLVPADYQNAYAGSYSDTLSVLVLP